MNKLKNNYHEKLSLNEMENVQGGRFSLRDHRAQLGCVVAVLALGISFAGFVVLTGGVGLAAAGFIVSGAGVGLGC